MLYLVMFSVIAFSGSGWLRGRDRVTEPLVWLIARDWTVSAVQVSNLHSININCEPFSGVVGTVGLILKQGSCTHAGGVHKGRTVQCT